MRIKLAIPLVLLSLFGCTAQPDRTDEKFDKTHPVAATSQQPVGYQRFVPVPRQPENLTGIPWSGAFALDTMTGQLCRTYPMADSKWEALPLCHDLWMNKANPNDPLGLFDDKSHKK
jgi:hypothetical protein